METLLTAHGDHFQKGVFRVDVHRISQLIGFREHPELVRFVVHAKQLARRQVACVARVQTGSEVVVIAIIEQRVLLFPLSFPYLQASPSLKTTQSMQGPMLVYFFSNVLSSSILASRSSLTSFSGPVGLGLAASKT